MKVTGDITTITRTDVAVTLDVLRIVALTYGNIDAPEPTIMRAAANLLRQRIEQMNESAS